LANRPRKVGLRNTGIELAQKKKKKKHPLPGKDVTSSKVCSAKNKLPDGGIGFVSQKEQFRLVGGEISEGKG